MGNILKDLGRFEESQESYINSLSIEPDYPEAHNNLGNLLKNNNKIDEAKACYEVAVLLNPDYAEAHNNLGNVLRNYGNYKDAEVSYRKAIDIKPKYSAAHSNLGMNLKDLGRFREAELSCRNAIDIEPGYAEGHCNLARVLYANDDLDSALISIDKANSIDSQSKIIKLLLNIFKARKANKINQINIESIDAIDSNINLNSNPLILKRPVEYSLIESLYKMKALELDKTNDPSYGNARGSGYYLFEDNNANSVIKTVEKDLISIITENIKADIYVEDSFYTILGAGGGVHHHNHISGLDKDNSLNLSKQKFSLVYYLCTGDQYCSEPGILKLYDPTEDVLPSEGMIIIFPADRNHSVVYNGEKDRIIIGMNFYCL